MSKVSLNIKIESELKARLSAQAKAEYRTVTDLATQAMLNYLEMKRAHDE